MKNLQQTLQECCFPAMQVESDPVELSEAPHLLDECDSSERMVQIEEVSRALAEQAP